MATSLIHELESRMKRKGIPKVNALILPWNDASAAFFSRNGYEVVEMKEAQKYLTPEKKRGIPAKKSR